MHSLGITHPKRTGSGFTLIELLIVIAIILILIAIALPNFIEAQIRARVVKVEAEMKGVATAVETYRTDNHGRNLPQWQRNMWVQWSGGFARGEGRFLTTPIRYLTRITPDPFNEIDARGASNESLEFIGFGWFNVDCLYNSWPVAMKSGPQLCLGVDAKGRAFRGYIGIHSPIGLDSAVRDLYATVPFSWLLESIGPDKNGVNINKGGAFYNPTNGTVSQGEIYYFDTLQFGRK